MKVDVIDKKKNHNLKAGDVVSVDRDLYLIINEARGYIAKGFCGEIGSTGYHDTLEGLHDSLVKHSYTHYSKEDYKLELKRK